MKLSVKELHSLWDSRFTHKLLCDFPGPGWSDLINETLLQIQEQDPNFSLIQVKEKFGQLNIYLNTDNVESVYDIIFEAEMKSLNICEFCGDSETAILRSLGWMKTLCDKCHQQRELKEGNRL